MQRVKSIARSAWFVQLMYAIALFEKEGRTDCASLSNCMCVSNLRHFFFALHADGCFPSIMMCVCMSVPVCVSSLVVTQTRLVPPNARLASQDRFSAMRGKHRV